MNRRGLCAAVAWVVLLSPGLRADDPVAPVGTRVTEFTLKDAVTDQPWVLSQETRDAKATVIVFLGTGCPASNAYTPRLKELYSRYSKEGIQFVGINSILDDEVADVAAWGKDREIPFPLLKDEGTRMADRLAIERVPTVLVLDATRTVRYKGRIDDQYAPGVHRARANTRELGNALDALIEGREIKVSHTPAAGCLITREREAKPPTTGEPITYSKHVAKIIHAKCLECHRPGEAGPFSLTDYKSAWGWSEMIREVVSDGIMPPWHADAPMGHFKNDRRLTPEEKQTLLAWIDQGCLEGDPKETPPVPTFTTGWRLDRAPDEVLKMKNPAQIPAQSLLGIGIPYHYVEVGEPFPEDRWVTAVEVRPEYREVVHHIIAFVIPPGGSFRDLARDDFGRHILGAYVPGDQPVVAPPGAARLIKKGSRILFELHYTPNGKAGTDQSMIGLIYAKDPPAIQLENLSVMNGRFRIPAGADNHVVKSEHLFPEKSVILSLTPHMHLRGKAFRYELVSPTANGQEERKVLLNVPKYDFNWQMTYDFAEPVIVPAGSRMECTAVFDNSAKNPFNPNPNKEVRWGNQTWDEMMIGFVMYHVAK